MKKSLTVAIMGPPNAGKSVLLNALVKDHVSGHPHLSLINMRELASVVRLILDDRCQVSAVSRKRNTTSSCILGATTIGNTQLVFTDTPGTIVDRK